ncbi:hypothetical protein FCM35_KLT13123 [Carex littledalei]|uniref:Uncharacterized protein n=1 Tax=Carex littledalei TaxID=544730 RepID=A0A833QPZ1_9POAL|nr:hypothetical protein FCM35_KLT13123 [Carex littledalei]
MESGSDTKHLVVKNKSSGRAVESGGFVLWQMAPDMWYIELVVGGSKVHAGSNGRLVRRHTPWLGSHAAKGPVRLLCRALPTAFDADTEVKPKTDKVSARDRDETSGGGGEGTVRGPNRGG